jgi:outer membrane immunogenic protein
MKKFLLTTVALGALAVPAMAADMAPAPIYKAPVPVPVYYNWTGWYVGANLGWKGVSSNMTGVPADAPSQAFNAACIAAGACPGNFGSNTGNGIIGGGQIGYNWQIANYVLGLETDFQGTSAKASTTIGTNAPGFVPFSGTDQTSEKWLGTFRGRAGYLFTPMFLGYVTGGFAYSGIDRTWSASFAAPATSAWSGTESTTLTGWTIGGGVEWALGNGFTLGAEYLYVKLSGNDSFLTTNQSGACASGGGPLCTFRVSGADVTDNIVRAKLNYKFW